MTRTPILVALILAGGLVVSACGEADEEGTFERAGKQVDEVVEQAAEELKETGEQIEEAAREAGKEAGQALQDAGEKLEEMSEE